MDDSREVCPSTVSEAAVHRLPNKVYSNLSHLFSKKNNFFSLIINEL